MKMSVLAPKETKPKVEVKTRIFQKEIKEEEVVSKEDVEIYLIRQTSNVIIVTCMVILKGIAD